jgi:hypothetical protein
MAYRDDDEPPIMLSALSFPDWIRASLALALGGAVFLLGFHLLAWLAGWPGPYLWFGTSNRMQDILSATAGIGAATLFMNLFGSVAAMLILTLRRKWKGPKSD